MNPWHAHPVPAMRVEALYGDRIVRCFADRPAGLHAMFERARAARGDHEAIVHEGRRWSYAEAGAEADRLAAGFAARGIGAGDRVLMLLSNRPEFLFVLLALQRLGAIAVPVGIREARPGLAFIAGQCGAIGIVFDDALADRVPLPEEAPALALRLAASGLATIASDGRRRAARGGAARDRHRGDPLHLGHDRPAQGRDAHASVDRAQRAALRGLHAPRRRRPLGAGGAGQPRHRADRDHRDDVARRRHGGRRPRVQGRAVRAAARARAHQPHPAGAGDVSPLPDERGVRARGPVALAGRRLRRRADAGGDDRRARRAAAAAHPAQCLRRHRDHLAGDADAARPGRRPRRLGRRAACPAPTSA